MKWKIILFYCKKQRKHCKLVCTKNHKTTGSMGNLNYNIAWNILF